MKLRTLSCVPITSRRYGCVWYAVSNSAFEIRLSGESSERRISSITTSSSFASSRRVEGRVQHRVGEHVDADRGVPARHRDVVDGHVVRGEGVDVAARALDRGRDLAHAALLGALEQHVLVDVRHAPLLGPLVGAAGAHPDVQRHDGRGVVLDQDHLESPLSSVVRSIPSFFGRLGRRRASRRSRRVGPRGPVQGPRQAEFAASRGSSPRRWRGA